MSSIRVVDDDRSTRQLLTEMLKTAGFSVASAKDGVDALKRLRAGSYDLMLLDVWMPALPFVGRRPRSHPTNATGPSPRLRRPQAWSQPQA
jgi:CheY-like chemotaxis protein